MKIATILGSVREGNNTAKALFIVEDELKKLKGMELIKIIPAELNLSLPGLSNESEDQTVLNEAIKDADGIVLTTPEYHGSYSSVIKLIIDNLVYPSLLKAKPIALLGVAAGKIGAIKSIEHIRSICAHMGAIVLPGSVSVANVQSVFDKVGNCLDQEIEKRLRDQANNLVKYIQNHICPEIAQEQEVRK